MIVLTIISVTITLPFLAVPGRRRPGFLFLVAEITESS